MAKTKSASKSSDGSTTKTKAAQSSGKAAAKKSTGSAGGGAASGEAGASKRSMLDLGGCNFTFQEALTLLMVVRSAAAAVSYITDCDETFNYWEPMHYMIHGFGLQTWEYSPVYALRSYFLLLPYGLPAYIMSLIAPTQKILAFYVVRACAGLVCALCEATLVDALRRSPQFGNRVATVTLFFLVLGVGMFHASTAFVPSTTAMYVSMVGFAAWLDDNDAVVIICSALNGFVTWPFAGALGLPAAADIVLRKGRLGSTVKWCIYAVLLVGVPTLAFDSWMYNKFVFASFNIINYNVLSSETDSELYGTEPWTYYFKNGILNFNLGFVLALLALPVAVVCPVAPKGGVLYLGPMLLWCGIYFTQAHKEERFLFPIYPLFCVAAARTLVTITEQVGTWITPLKNAMRALATFVVVAYALLSVSRGIAIIQSYHAPLDVYAMLPPDAVGDVCVGKEWHRFPTSFFLPPKTRLQFIKSEFDGLLPKAFSESPDGYSAIPTAMNNMNKEEVSRYIPVDECEYLVDQDRAKAVTELEPRYKLKTEDWGIASCAPYLEATESHPIYRAWYVPTLSPKHTKFNDYCLLGRPRRASGRSRAAGGAGASPGSVKGEAVGKEGKDGMKQN